MVAVFSLVMVGLVTLLMQAASAAEILAVDIDQALVTKLPERVATVVVGNPMIADVSLQAGNIMVLTGKGYGTTNVVALDRSGTVLMDKSVEVHGPRDHVLVMYRGGERETYSCSPRCERRITPGDAAAFFDPAVQQTSTRNNLAQSSSAPPTTGVGRVAPAAPGGNSAAPGAVASSSAH